MLIRAYEFFILRLLAALSFQRSIMRGSLCISVLNGSFYFGRFEVLTVTLLKVHVFWDDVACRLVSSFHSSKARSASILRVTTAIFVKPVTTYQSTRRNIAKDPNLQVSLSLLTSDVGTCAMHTVLFQIFQLSFSPQDF